MKILVVDDEEDMQVLFQQKFRKEIRDGIAEFAFATSADLAKDYLNQNHQEVVLILSDINMPRISGLELLEHIKQTYFNPPPIVLMITAYGDEENYKLAMELGADEFLIKPIDFSELKKKLKI